MASELAQKLLRDLEDDPLGVPYLDVESMLDAWGIIGRLPGEEPIGYCSRIHEEAPNYPIAFPRRDPLPRGVVEHVCRAVRHLEKRLSL